eukprot:PhM_4_TR2802/c0_g1_i1/m.67295/K05309/PTGES2; microsomal prostaglandin-E synthase 2
MFRRVLKLGAGVTLLGSAGGYYMYQERLKSNKVITAEAFNAGQNVDAVREQCKAIMEGKSTAADLELYRYTTCPFCSKVKAFLDLHHVEHTCVEVEPIFKSEIKGHGYGKVPQIKFGKTGDLMVDSDIIVNALSEYVKDKTWRSEMQRPEVNKWREFARERLVKYLVININTSLLEAWKGYEYIDSHDTIPASNKVFLKVLGAPVMYLVAQYKTLPHLAKVDGYNITTTPPPAALTALLREWVNGGLDGGKKTFNGGSKPNIADVEVYGVLQSVRGHRVYDTIVCEVPEVKAWLGNMDKRLGQAVVKFQQTNN